MTRLVVADAHDVSWLETARAVARDGDTWDLLLLGVGAEPFDRRHGAELRTLSGSRVLDVPAFAAAAGPAVSRFAIDLVEQLPGYDVGGRTLGDRLRHGRKNLWWSLEITEKSAFRGRLIERLYRMALVAEALGAARYDEIWMHVGDPLLAGAIETGVGTIPVRRIGPLAPPSAQRFTLAYWNRALAAVGRAAGVKLLALMTAWQTAVAPGGLGVFTLFPYWWIDPFGSRPTDRFFSAPVGASDHYVAWVTWPGRVWRHRRALAATLAARRIVPLQAFARWGDIARALSPARFFLLSRVRRLVANHLRVRFLTFDISAVVADELGVSMADAELFFDDLLQASLRRYFAAARPSALAYRVECQPWEHALVGAARDAGVRAVGFFHSMYGETYPALRFAPGDVNGIDRGAGPRPMPPALVVPGGVIEGYVERDGYSRDAVARCGPQRHAAFLEFLASRPSRAALRDRFELPHEVPIYFVAIAIVETETEGLFACLERALAGAGESVLLIKTHPNRPDGDLSMRSAIDALGPSRVRFVPAGADMYEFLAASDSMVCIGSTVAFEAMALGVMPIVYEHPGTFPATSLRAFDDALYVVNSAETLRAALEEVSHDGAGAARRRAAWARTLDGVFGDMRTPLQAQLQQALARLGASPSPDTEVRLDGIC